MRVEPIATALAVALLACSAATTAVAAPGNAGRELIRDPLFARGFAVLAPTGGRQVLGRIQFADASAAPAWQLAQWHSRFPLTQHTAAASARLCVSNAAKWLCLTRAGDTPPTLTLGVDSRPEYADRLRRDSSEPWVHLLVQQDIPETPSLAELDSLRLRFQARLDEAATFRPEGYTPSLHAAQFQIVLTLNCTRPGAPGFGDFLWFVVPVYDDRYEVPPEYIARDFAVTPGKLIFNPGWAAFTTNTVRSGGWVSVDAELRPLLERALRTAWIRGYLLHSRELADYRVASLNLGWEVPGLNRVAIRLRNLSLRARRLDVPLPLRNPQNVREPPRSPPTSTPPAPTPPPWIYRSPAGWAAPNPLW